MEIMILKTDKRTNVKAGEIYRAKRYHMEPLEKLELIERIPDGFDPQCTQYICSVAAMVQGKWHKVVNNKYVEIPEHELPEV